MSERESEEGPAERGAVPVEPNSTPAIEPEKPPSGSPRGSGRVALWLAGLLILILAGVALSPFWAPHIEPLFPWGENRDEYAALAARVAAVEARPVAPSKGIDAVQSTVSELARRVDQLDSRLAAMEKRPALPGVDTDAINSAVSALGAPRRSTRGRRQTRPRCDPGRTAATRATARCDRNPIRLADGERHCRIEGYAAGALPPRQDRRRTRGP